jgi:hypothetical protein
VQFEKINFIWQDERAQIGGLPEPLRAKLSSGVACDEVEGAIGDFGRAVRNPIPVNGPLGELIYLSNLRTMKSQKIMFHRLGSLGGIDAYEVVSLDGEVWDILFLDLYHPRKSHPGVRCRISNSFRRRARKASVWCKRVG